MQELIQETLWKKAGRICTNCESSGSNLWVPGLVFLKYMSHAFDRLFRELKEDGDYPGRYTGDMRGAGKYFAQNLLYIPSKSRWEYVMDRSGMLGIGSILDEAMEDIERFNPAVERILPREYTSPDIQEDQLALFIEMLGEIPKEYSRTGEILRSVYNYFVRHYLAGTGKGQERICPPGLIEKLLVAMVDPVRGSLFDPCCGVGGMLVESHTYVSQRQNQDRKIDDVVFYGQESNVTNFRLCRMNLAIHGMDGSRIGCNGNSCFEADMFPGLKADYILCEPPYNENNSNFHWSWLRYITSHMARGGVAGIVLSKDSLTTLRSGKTADRNEAREYLVQNGLVRCIVSLPDRHFPETDTGTSACLWILAEGKGRGLNSRDQGILFIDASPGIPAISSLPAELPMMDIDEISNVFHRWQGKDCKKYADVKGFCKFADFESVKRQHYDLLPENYV